MSLRGRVYAHACPTRRNLGRIANEVRGINRAIFDIPRKPPSTIACEGGGL